MNDMPNNLNKMIEKSGLQKKVVAERKGVTPETLSRHIHERVPMTIVDAREYADILGCHAYEIVFEQAGVPIIGHCHLHQDSTVFRELYLNMHDTKQNPQLIKGLDWAYSHTRLPFDAAIISWSMDKKYTGPWAYWSKAHEYVMLEPVLEQYVHEECYGKQAFCYLKNAYEGKNGPEHFVAGMLFPEPGGVYQIVNGDLGWHLKEQELVFATPVITVSLRQRLRGVTMLKGNQTDI
jgi:hypothetical protein|tara:strand:- start:558 stop:1265 length:708 start_codon:yes stop_codon:yes gene_type:complete